MDAAHAAGSRQQASVRATCAPEFARGGRQGVHDPKVLVSVLQNATRTAAAVGVAVLTSLMDHASLRAALPTMGARAGDW